MTPLELAHEVLRRNDLLTVTIDGQEVGDVLRDAIRDASVPVPKPLSQYIEEHGSGLSREFKEAIRAAVVMEAELVEALRASKSALEAWGPSPGDAFLIRDTIAPLLARFDARKTEAPCPK